MSPVQGKSPLCRLKNPIDGSLNMVICWLSSCKPECTKHVLMIDNAPEGVRYYIDLFDLILNVLVDRFSFMLGRVVLD